MIATIHSHRPRTHALAAKPIRRYRLPAYPRAGEPIRLALLVPLPMGFVADHERDDRATFGDPPVRCHSGRPEQERHHEGGVRDALDEEPCSTERGEAAFQCLSERSHDGEHLGADDHDVAAAVRFQQLGQHTRERRAFNGEVHGEARGGGGRREGDASRQAGRQRLE